MKTRLKTVYILLILSLASVAMIGCDGNGETVVIVEEGGYLYEPAVIRNDSWDDILLDSAELGQGLLDIYRHRFSGPKYVCCAVECETQL